MPAPCIRCQSPLEAGDEVLCPSCGAYSTVRIFPASWQGSRPAAGEAAAEGDATCYDHAGKRAVAACARCGRFVCQLCAVDFKGSVWCPSCVITPAAELESARPLYDSMALFLATLPLLVWPFTVLTAPLALYTSIRYWRRPLSVTRKSRWRFMAAILLAALQIVGWVALLAFVAARGGRIE